MIDRDEVRDQIAHAMGWTTGHFGDVLDAVMAVVDPIVAERDDYRANGKEAAKVAFGVSEKLATVEAELAETHAAHRAALLGVSRPGQPTYEALEEHVAGLVQENGVLRGELDEAQRSANFWQSQAETWEREHQNTVLPYTSQLEDDRALLAWLHAEAVWQRDEARRLVDHWKDGHDYAIKREDKHRARAMNAEYETVQLRNRVAELVALRASAVVLPEDWRQRVYDVLTSGETIISCAADGLQVEMDGAVAAVVDLLESWRPATAEATTPSDLQVPPSLGATADDVAMQTASCHVFECRNDRTADSPYCPAHTQITELLAAAPFLPVDREALIGIIEGTDYGAGGWVSRTSTEHAATIADALISAGVVAQPPAWWKGQEIEWNSTGDTWQPGVIIAPLAPVVALIRLHDNGQRLNVETRHLRARGSSREAGQP